MLAGGRHCDPSMLQAHLYRLLLMDDRHEGTAPAMMATDEMQHEFRIRCLGEGLWCGGDQCHRLTFVSCTPWIAGAISSPAQPRAVAWIDAGLGKQLAGACGLDFITAVQH